MRSPVIAFSLLAAAVSPSLVSGAPASPKLDNALAQTENAATMTHAIRADPLSNIGGVTNMLGGSAAKPPAAAHTDDPVHRTQAMKLAKAQPQQGSGPVKAAAIPAAAPKAKAKRSGDNNTAGGNAYSGAAQDSSGGDVVNDSQDGTITNADGSNPGGGAGSSFSGFAFGGNGDGHGPGGNAYTGATGASRGGNVINTSENAPDGDADAIDNTTANNAGGGGFSESGSAEGGDASGPALPAGVRRRAGDNGTAGGSAYSGATSDVSGGSVVNSADDQGTVTNTGGNAYTGSSGPATGGSVYNYGGTIDNAADSNAAGGGGVSQTGDATGGRA